MPNRGSTIDFRRSMIRRRLQNVKKMLIVLSGKGGVGKSVVSATIAALLGQAGFNVGLMDADVYGPSSAFILDAHAKPTEGKRGLIPPVAGGIKIMSVDFFAPGKPIPLTGGAARQVILEMLALTDWGRLDYLVVDMPPATSDIMITLTSLPRSELSTVVVTMPDRLSLSVAHRVVELLHAGRIPILGVLGNMYRPTHQRTISDDDGPKRLAEEFKTTFLGEMPYDVGVREAVEKGDVNGLLKTTFARTLNRSVKRHLLEGPHAQRKD